jgi:hypothetical protein
MPQKKKTRVQIFTCRSCGGSIERVSTRGRPPVMCEACKKAPAKNPRHGIPRSGAQHRGGRGNVRLRACGCPSRQHRPSCPKSRSFTPPKEDEVNDRIAWVNKNRREKREAARVRRAAKIAAEMRDHTVGMQATNGLDLPVMLSCVKCKARGMLRDFKMWNRTERVGFCKNCGAK